MFTQIGAKPESDFSEPLGMLRDCHKRIQFFLGDLTRLAETAEEPLEPTRRTALERALRYFRESGPRHTADEEESLFPRMRSIADARVEQALREIGELEADHERANAAHASVEIIGTRWLSEGALSGADIARLRSLMRELAEIYEHHLEVEDNAVFPLAASLLSGQDKNEIGREMATRRGRSPAVVRDPFPKLK